MEIVCFSHLRWDFVFQRPQHLLTRFADHFRIFYVEEAYFHAESDHYTEVSHNNIHVIKLHIKGGPENADVVSRQQSLISNFVVKYKIKDFILWYYTPMALPISRQLKASAVVFDCMDELSAFKFAPPALKQLEKELLNKADIVFTGGHSLYQAKRHQHNNIHSFPSSIDKKHFAAARTVKADPADQAGIPYPRFGFYGVIDERFDIELIREVSAKRPDWQMVLVGPVVKIDPATLPQGKNIHYLGSKTYAELPSYLGGWDIAMVSFALNESTTYISPTKTPEYLAGGKPVISTPIKDVVEPYGKSGIVHIAANADEFIAKAEQELAATNKKEWLKKVDLFLSANSWDITVNQMRRIIYQALAKNQRKEYVTPHFMVVEKSLPAAS